MGRCKREIKFRNTPRLTSLPLLRQTGSTRKWEIEEIEESSIHPSTHLLIHSSTHPHIHTSTHTNIQPFTHPPFTHPHIHHHIQTSTLHTSTHASIRPSAHPFIYPNSIHYAPILPSEYHPCTHPSTRLSIRPFIHPSFNPSFFPFISFIYLSSNSVRFHRFSQ